MFCAAKNTHQADGKKISLQLLVLTLWDVGGTIILGPLNRSGRFSVCFLFFSFFCTGELEGSPVYVSVQAVRPSRPQRKKKKKKKQPDCSHQESRLDHTAGVRFWRIGLNLHTHTHKTYTSARVQRACEPFTWSRTGANGVDRSCIKRFYDVNGCVHKSAALQLLPLAAAEYKNALLVNLSG